MSKVTFLKFKFQIKMSTDLCNLVDKLVMLEFWKSDLMSLKSIDTDECLSTQIAKNL